MITKSRDKTRLLTAEDLLRLYSEGVRGELIQGVLHEIMPTGKTHGRIVMVLGHLMMKFIKPRKLGWLVGSDTGVRLERNPDTVREPGIAFVSSQKLALDDPDPGYLEVVPDLVVEIVSPNDSLGSIFDKAQMWLRYGVSLVWVVYPETRTVEVYRMDASRVTFNEDDTLDGGTVLPGFNCPVKEIFDL